VAVPLCLRMRGVIPPARQRQITQSVTLTVEVFRVGLSRQVADAGYWLLVVTSQRVMS
jgi:hypothetical protein